MKHFIIMIFALLSISSAFANNSSIELRMNNLLNSNEIESLSEQLSYRDMFLSQTLLSETQFYNGSTTFDVVYTSNVNYFHCVAVYSVGNINNDNDIELIINDCLE